MGSGAGEPPRRSTRHRVTLTLVSTPPSDEPEPADQDRTVGDPVRAAQVEALEQLAHADHLGDLLGPAVRAAARR